MLSRITSVLQQAVEALAPSVSRQEDFVYHWRAVTNYFIEHKHGKVPIEQTNIPNHLGEMLKLLVEEEGDIERGSTGPCMEYLLQHKLLETLYTLGRTDFPPGMKQAVLSFFTKLLSRIHQPILPHINVHRAVHRLIKMCGEVTAGPTEIEEVHFLCTVCSQLKMHPHLTNFFLENFGKDAAPPGSPILTTKKEFGLISSLLSLSHSEDGRVAVKACEGLMLCASLSEPGAAECIANQTPFCQEMTNRLCQLYERLPRKVDPYDLENVQAKWGLDILPDRDDSTSFAGKRCVISFLSWLDYCDQVVSVANPVVSAALVESVRRNFLVPIVEPSLLQASETGTMLATLYITQCLRTVTCPALLRGFVYFLLGEETSTELPYHFSHKLRHRLIDHCNHLSDDVSIATLKLFGTLLMKDDQHILNNLALRNISLRNYVQTSDTSRNGDVTAKHSAIKSLTDTNKREVHNIDESMQAILNKQSNTDADNLSENITPGAKNFGESNTTDVNALTPDISEHDTCNSNATPDSGIHSGISSDSLEINDNFETNDNVIKISDLSNDCSSKYETTKLNLTENHTRLLTDNVLNKDRKDVCVTRTNPDHFDPASTVLPSCKSDFHKVVSCFLNLVPEGAKSSLHSSESGYDVYLRDAQREVSDCQAMCKRWKSPVIPPPTTNADPKTPASLKHDTTQSTHQDDSAANMRFYEGSFLHMLLDKLSRMLTQSYEVNLQLSSVIAKLCVFPDPYLHEFLLDPCVVLKPEARTPYTLFVKLVGDIQQRMKSDHQLSAKLVCVRQKLISGESLNRMRKCAPSNKARVELADGGIPPEWI